MYKTPQLNTVRSVLARPKTVHFQSSGHRFRAMNTTSNEVKPKSRFLLYTTSTLLTGIISTAGIVVYSKYDPKFRKMLTENVPALDKYIGILLFEDKEFVEQSKQLGGRVVCKVAQQVKSIKESLGVQPDNFVDKSIEQIKSVSKSLPTTIPILSTINEEKKPEEKKEPQKPNVQSQNKSVESNSEQIKPKNKSPELPPAPVILPPIQYTLKELETDILNNSSLGVNALKKATESLKEYSKNIYELVESSSEIIDPNLSVKLQQLEDKKNAVFTKAYEDGQKYKNEIIEKQKLLNNSKIEVSPDELTKTMLRTNEALAELTNANLVLENEEHKLSYIQKYKSNVLNAQASLIEEFESLFPGSDITQPKINMKNNDFDVFLLYALKKLNYYQDKLTKQEVTLDRKVNNAMSADFLNVETINEMNSRLNAEIHKLDEQFKTQLNEYNIKIDKDLQEQLKLHTQAHADLVAKAVDFSKEEFENRVRQELSTIENLEQQKYQYQLEFLKSDLQNVVDNLKKQAEKEKKLLANQAIWEAGEFLKSLLASSDNEKPIDIKNQLNNIKQLGESNSLIKHVVNSVPSKALEKGVLSKGQLKEDFNRVEKRVYQTALIPDNRFNLPLMAFSYLASLFVVHHSHVSSNEVNNEEFDPLELNTFEIVERARYCVDRDDILQALRYLNLLTGCSRVVAKEWMKEAIVFLETKQAIDLLTSYATVTSFTAVHGT